MIDLTDLRNNPDRYKLACTKKRSSFDVDAFLALDKDYRALKTELEQLRASQNRVSKEIPKAQGDAKQKMLDEMKTLVAKLKDDEARFKTVEEEWNKKQLYIPNPPLDRVPEGKDDSENVEVRRHGDLPQFSFKPKSHVEIANALGIIEFERGVKIAGSRSYFLVGDGMRLAHAVLSFTMDLLHRKGYLLMDPPHIVGYQAMMGTSYFPGGEEQAYHLDQRDDDRYLIGTAEVPVTSFHMDETLALTDLPKRYAGYSPCYRREAGTYGKDTQGVYRIHQFYKVEQVIICRADPEESMKLHNEILGNAEEVIRALKLPYRVVDVCTGDMGQGQVYKNDIETWMPSRNNYGETHSCSSFYDFQARRLNLKYKDENGKNRVCYTLNNTCIASPRILIPILELYQNADGTVTVPDVLRPYMGGQERIVAR